MEMNEYYKSLTSSPADGDLTSLVSWNLLVGEEEEDSVKAKV